MMQTIQLVAPCLFGLERYVKEEIYDLGYETDEVMDGRVLFTGDLEAIARANLHLRCAERVMLLLARFPARTFEELYQGVKAVNWPDYAAREDAVIVTGSSVRSTLSSIPACQRITKKAIADRLCAAYGLTRLPETGVRLPVQFFLLRDEAMLLLDTSGVPLHKRGYRAEGNLAPIRETLAAALVHQSHYRGREVFADPFCGSGTIAIEAAMRARRMAPGLRRSFAFESFGFLPPVLLRDAREEALEEIIPCELPILASDIDPAMADLTAKNARLAGVESCLRIRTMPVSEFHPEASRGTLICNPPYGERMSERLACEELYREMGRVFSNLRGWSTYIITSHEEFEDFFGRKANKRRKLYNGMIRCDLYQYYAPRLKRSDA
jgi:putative N6-adenine-specific DNA methylase